MKVAYLDSSWAVAITFGEHRHQALLAKLGEYERVFSSPLLEAELFSACAREQLAADPHMTSAIDWVIPDRPLTDEIRRVLEAGHLRGADTWHVACALFLSGHPGEIDFLTVDPAQQKVAQTLGFGPAQ